MKIRNLVLGALCGITFFSCSASGGGKDAEMDRFITDLMGKMTIREKLGQLNLPSGGDLVTGSVMNTELGDMIRKEEIGGFFNVKGVKKIYDLQRLAVEETRLKIPLIVGADVIHGYETIFPIPLALSCSWDTLAVQQMARISAIEASADGICWTFSPMVDICRDARWGRIAEGSGEDPYLGSLLAKAYVRGYQGNNMQGRDEILSCVKHFALYGASEAGKDYNTVDMSHLRMYNEYFAPYRAAVEAGVGSVMSSFNIVDGIPATANKWLLTDVLRDEWGFQGLLVTDYNSIAEMAVHGVAPLEEASVRALQAGTDMDMVSCGFLNTLEESLKEGKVTEAQINTACRRVLEAKYKLGLFADPYKYCDTLRVEKELYTADHRAAAREIAAKTFVLLKNEKQVLPLKDHYKKIALIGYHAADRYAMLGDYTPPMPESSCVTVLSGMKNEAPEGVSVEYTMGSGFNQADGAELEKALKLAKESDVIVVAAGGSSSRFGGAVFDGNGAVSKESGSLSMDCGEGMDSAMCHIPAAQEELILELSKLGKPLVVLLIAGRPYCIEEIEKASDAVLYSFYPGPMGGKALADLVYGNCCPSGRLPASLPRHVGQLPVYYNSRSSSTAAYRDMESLPLHTFGEGLSYTGFSISDVRTAFVETEEKHLDVDSGIRVSFRIKNTGDQEGTAVPLLFSRRLQGSPVPRVKELKAFTRVELKAGEEKEVSLTVKRSALDPVKVPGRRADRANRVLLMLTEGKDECWKEEVIL